MTRTSAQPGSRRPFQAISRTRRQQDLCCHHLITRLRGANDQDRRTAVAQMLAAIAAEGGPAAVEQAALGLTDVAGMLVELYADHMDASPDQVLQEAATLMADMGPWG